MDRNQIIVLGVGLLAIVAAAAIGGQYVGAYLFLHLEKIPQQAVSMFTLHDYWSAYSDVLAVKRVLVVCNFVALGIAVAPVVLAGVVIASVGRRALHGDARFARDSEIRKSGLVSKS